MVSCFLTHAEVVVDPEVPIESWGLFAAGRRRAAAAHRLAWSPGIGRIVSSAERKAEETAAVLARAVGSGPDVEVEPALGEIDRSATGYLPPAEFEAVVDAFFARPDESVRGGSVRWTRRRGSSQPSGR